MKQQIEQLISRLAEKSSACTCKGDEVQTYKRTTSMKDPFNARKRHDGWVCIDTCLAREIGELWLAGVLTLECCCGHKVADDEAYILVTKESAPKMLALGYEQLEDPMSNGRDTFFYPKILAPKPILKCDVEEKYFAGFQKLDAGDFLIKLAQKWQPCGFTKSLQSIFEEAEWEDLGEKCDHVVCNDVGYRGGCQLQAPKQPHIRELFEFLLSLNLAE